MDHCSHLQYIDETIPIYVGECTLRIIESFEPTKERETLGVHNYKTFRTGKKIKIGIDVEPIHVDHSVLEPMVFLFTHLLGQ
ncbi:MAG: hypothetical protein QXX08_09670 [Candidatus Bathyarchaeia archaeon]